MRSGLEKAVSVEIPPKAVGSSSLIASGKERGTYLESTSRRPIVALVRPRIMF